MVLQQIKSYFKVAYLLHVITLVELFLIVIVLESDWFTQKLSFARFSIGGLLISLPFFAQLDARSRYQNYKMARDQFYFYGFQTKIVKPFAQSRCQRDAVMVAAFQLGCHEQCNAYFRGLGYRWYHIFPDLLFKEPANLFHRKFWQTTFWLKYYKSRVSHKKIYLEKMTYPVEQVKMAI